MLHPKRMARFKPHNLRASALFAMTTLVFVGAAPDAQAYYDVTIGTTERAGAWVGNEWTPSGAGSTVSASAIQSKLAAGPVTITTGTSTDGGDSTGSVGVIQIDQALSWNANILTLTASSTININAVMTAGGSAGLALNTTLLSPSGEINVGMDGSGFTGRVDFTGSGNTISINGAPGTIVTTLGAGGINNFDGLQGMYTGYYVLGADIDASPSAAWNNGMGFTPIRLTDLNGFLSRFDGLGHTVDGLTMNRPGEPAGLFRGISLSVRNLGLTNVNIVGSSQTGALAGWATGGNAVVANVYVTGSVTGDDDVGGVVGDALNGSKFTDVHVAGSVMGRNHVGGLVGRAILGVSFSKSYVDGSITGVGTDIGGLIGQIGAVCAFLQRFLVDEERSDHRAGGGIQQHIDEPARLDPERGVKGHECAFIDCREQRPGGWKRALGLAVDHRGGADEGHEARRVIGRAARHFIALVVPGLDDFGIREHPCAGLFDQFIGRHHLIHHTGGLGLFRIVELAFEQER